MSDRSDAAGRDAGLSSRVPASGRGDYSKSWRGILAAAIVGALSLGSASMQAADGDLDPTFGVGGLALTEFPDDDAYGRRILVQPDGRILIAGDVTGDPVTGADCGLARFHPDGSLDTSFSFDGRTRVSFTPDAGYDSCFSAPMALQSDGKILIAAAVQEVGEFHDRFGIARLMPDGTLDPSFGTGGKVVFGFDLVPQGGSRPMAITLQPDGRIVVVGQAVTDTITFASDIAVARLLPDGSFDSSFNLSGRRAIGINRPGSSMADQARAVAIDGQGRIVIAGAAAGPPAVGNDFVIVRLLPNGALDGNFNAGGIRLVGFDIAGNRDDVALWLRLRRNGRIIVGGVATTTVSDQSYDFAVLQLHPDGSLDSSFGTGGRRLIAFDLVAGGADIAWGGALQSDGKLLLGGYALRGIEGDEDAAMASARLDRNGELDFSYGSFGKRIHDFDLGGVNQDAAFDVALGRDGRILLGGMVTIGADFAGDMAVVRQQNDLILAADLEGFESLR